METVTDKILLTDFAQIASGFYERVRKGPRDLTRIHKISDIPYNTLQMWGAPRKGKESVPKAASVPDIHKACIIAEAQGVSPAWLCFEMGPQDPIAARNCFDFAILAEENPGLEIVASAFVDGDTNDRQAMLTLAGYINGIDQSRARKQTAKTDPDKAVPIKSAKPAATASASGESAQQSTLRQAAIEKAKELNRRLRSTLSESPDFELFADVSKLLIDLSSNLNQPSHPSPNPGSPDAVGANAAGDTSASMPFDKIDTRSQ